MIQVEGWLAVCFNAPLVEVFRVEDRRRHPGLGSLGPDLCRADVDLEACVRRMAQYCDGHEEIGDVLLDQRICCGVGNVYKSEVLWATAGSIRARRSERSGPRTCLSLVETAADLLQANLGGGERATVTGGLAVYGRAGKPCLRCHTPIEVMRQGINARVTYWCPGVPAARRSLTPSPTRSRANNRPSAAGYSREFAKRAVRSRSCA